MDFIDEVRTRSGRFAKRVDHLDTEEATKNALVLPFIQMLGYEIFDPTEVVPEFTADIGTKRGEKVDFALMQDDIPVILIECKKIGAKLDEGEMSQLLRYFGVTETRIGILTDGILYRFFSDLDQANVMDPRPFFEFNMLDFTEPQVRELKRFTKSDFDHTQIVDAARELRYTTEIKRLLARELANPSDDFVTFVIRQVYEGRVTASVRTMFNGLTRSAFTQFINDKINDRLTSALERTAPDKPADQEPEAQDTEIAEFVQNELEALNIIRAIAAGTVDARRIGLRAAKNYCSVVLHGDAERADYGLVVCRLRVRRDTYLRLDIPNEKPERLDDLNGIYNYADGIRTSVSTLDETWNRTESRNAMAANNDSE